MTSPATCRTPALKFDAQEVAVIVGVGEDGTFVELCITGNLLDGTAFTACDCVRIMDCGPVPVTPSTWGAVKATFR